jgi:uncharacterized membrane protein YfcA
MLRRTLHRAGTAPAHDRQTPPAAWLAATHPPHITLPDGATRLALGPLLAVGVAIGALAGLLGVGGGFMLVPLLVYAAGLPTLMAVGTSLLCLLLASVYGAAAYTVSGHAWLPAALIMFAGALAGIPLGVRASRRVPAAHLQALYALMLLCGGGAVLCKHLGWQTPAIWVIFSSTGAMAARLLLATLRAAPHAPRVPPPL